jgi:hypothetical protein
MDSIEGLELNFAAAERRTHGVIAALKIMLISYGLPSSAIGKLSNRLVNFFDCTEVDQGQTETAIAPLLAHRGAPPSR